MTPEDMQSVLKHLSGSYSQSIAAVTVDLALARAENDKLTAQVADLEDKLSKAIAAAGVATPPKS